MDKRTALQFLDFDKENFESWVDMDGKVTLTDTQWEAIADEIDGRTANYLDEMIYELVKDFRDGIYDNV